MAETLRKPDSGGSSTISLEAPMATEHDTSPTTTYHIDLDVSDGQSSDASSPGHFSCLFDPVKKTNGLLMLLFDSDGNSTLKEMSRQHVLRMTQEAARSVSSMCPGSKLPAETASVCDLQPVRARDIRRMENAFSSSNEPSVVIRQQAIFFSADPLRAIILRDACLVYVPDGADSLLSMLKHCFMMNARDDTSPYEFRALEALLATLTRYFRAQYDQLSPIIIVDLERLVHGHLDARELERLREFKNTMNEFESQVDGVRRVLMELLDNEEDLRLLYLTKLFETPSLLAKLYSFDSEEAEVLIENYLQEIFSTRTTAELLQRRITNTESLVTLKIDSMRNYLLKVQLIFSLVSISIAVGTMVSGMFGMNLTSGLESAAHWFWGVVLATLLFFIASTSLGVVFFQAERGHAQASI